MSDAAANRIGRTFYGLAVLGTGLQQLAIAQFVRIVPRLPHWIPAQPLLARLGGILLVAIALALLTGKLARLAASILAVLLLAVLLFLYLPAIPTNPLAGFMYTNPLKVLSLVGGLMLLVPLLPQDPYSGGAKLLERMKPVAPWLLAAFLVVCGIQHFWYLDFVQTLIPDYIPSPRSWAQFAGVCLLAGGIGLLVAGSVEASRLDDGPDDLPLGPDAPHPESAGRLVCPGRDVGGLRSLGAERGGAAGRRTRTRRRYFCLTGRGSSSSISGGTTSRGTRLGAPRVESTPERGRPCP
jgi:uncharacterized membrane protein